MKATCSGCDVVWPMETNRAHCSACHATFSNAQLFDAHRWTDYRVRGKGHGCLHPSRLFLTLREGTWYRDVDEEAQEDS